MKKSIAFYILAVVLFLGCSKKEEADYFQSPVTSGNKVLLLKVDYLTHTFEGGTEFEFPQPSATFTVSYNYKSPGDFGNITLFYKELNEKLFDGSIIWMGKGEMNFPKTLLSPKQFAMAKTYDLIQPAGFENIFDSSSTPPDYTKIWMQVQHLARVRAYLAANPKQAAKFFLYTPSVGIGNPADWDWFILLKN